MDSQKVETRKCDEDSKEVLVSNIALRGNLLFSTAHFNKLQDVTHHHLLQQFIDNDFIVDMGKDLRKWIMGNIHVL